MSRAALAAVVCVAVLAASIVAIAAAGSGSEPGSDFGTLAWDGKPKLFTHETLPDDRVLSGVLRNDSLADVELAASDVELVDADGRPVEHTALFSRGYARDIYPPSAQRALPEADKVRLGLKLKLKPGEERPITLAWRVSDPARQPVRVELPQGSLDLPRSDSRG